MARFNLFSSNNVQLDILPEVVIELNAHAKKIDELRAELIRATNDNTYDHNLSIYAAATMRAEKAYWDKHPDEYQAMLEAQKQERKDALAREYARGERCA